MKKQIYSSIGVLAALQVHSQITLTQAANAPAPGDVQSIKLLDSTAALDKSGGASKTWNYSTSVTNSTNTVMYLRLVTPQHLPFPVLLNLCRQEQMWPPPTALNSTNLLLLLWNLLVPWMQMALYSSYLIQ